MRKQAEDQEATLLAQEEEVHGKQRELDALKEEEKKLLEDIKNSEKEIQKLSHDLEVATEINSEVSNSSILTFEINDFLREFVTFVFFFK